MIDRFEGVRGLPGPAQRLHGNSSSSVILPNDLLDYGLGGKSSN
jgi:hypothetical protein